MPRDALDWIDDELQALDAQHLRRRLRAHGGAQTALLQVAGRELINFASNDYLALAADPRLAEASAAACRELGSGSGASPLIVGRGPAHEELERELARFEGTEAALLFSCGYAANQGTVAALVDRGDAVYSDALNHASLIDGCRLSRADVHVYPHADCDALAEQLRDTAGRYRRRLIATDSLFSMLGDLAPLDRIAELADEFECMLLVDDAHATGIFGRCGRGTCEHLGVEDRVDVRVATLSKALGCSGGFVAGSQRLIDWLVNRARPYVFSTAPPPGNSAAALAALQIVCDEPARRVQLLARSAALRTALREQGWDVGPSASQIIPLVLGSSERVLAMAGRLWEQGLWVPAIRTPTVPAGGECLRISLSCGHTEEMIARLTAALAAERLSATR